MALLLMEISNERKTSKSIRFCSRHDKAANYLINRDNYHYHYIYKRYIGCGKYKP